MAGIAESKMVNSPEVGRQQIKQHPNGGGFSGAIRPQKSTISPDRISKSIPSTAI